MPFGRTATVSELLFGGGRVEASFGFTEVNLGFIAGFGEPGGRRSWHELAGAVSGPPAPE